LSEVKANIIHDKSDDKLHISHSQDVSGVLEANKKAREQAEGRRMGEMQRVASIPNVIAIQWMQEGINVMAPNKDDLKRMKKKLNSPEFAYLRTGGGRL
jgi:hypothetical protein|tara:strand:+ start:309 stop:605 length:297 start_codon:yes stop_codon:yes gene_type:complete